MPPQGGRKHPHQEFIQIDTTNVLFIVGGAFAGLDKIIEQRIGKKALGFTASMDAALDTNPGNVFGRVMPEDMLKFGMIPEFIGRLPMIATLHELNEAALIDILTKPKNALVKQYQKFFELEDVELEIMERVEGARAAVAQLTRERDEARACLREMIGILEFWKTT
mgnify:CR=1 FL=1